MDEMMIFWSKLLEHHDGIWDVCNKPNIESL